MLIPTDKKFEPWITNHWLALNDEKKMLLYIEVYVPKIAAGSFTNVDLELSDRKSSDEANKKYKFMILVDLEYTKYEPEEKATKTVGDDDVSTKISS